MSRFSLQQRLLQAAETQGAKVIFGSSIQHINPDIPEVVLSDGTVMKADLIIGADGKIESCSSTITCDADQDYRNSLSGARHDPWPHGQGL